MLSRTFDVLTYCGWFLSLSSKRKWLSEIYKAGVTLIVDLYEIIELVCYLFLFFCLCHAQICSCFGFAWVKSEGGHLNLLILYTHILISWCVSILSILSHLYANGICRHYFGFITQIKIHYRVVLKVADFLSFLEQTKKLLSGRMTASFVWKKWVNGEWGCYFLSDSSFYVAQESPFRFRTTRESWGNVLI